jgi:NDP-4-keto-2,6-dideoxyhexose 3-C-methyltransferase
MFTEIQACRICGNAHLTTLLSLGEQALTGVFPSSSDQVVEEIPVELVKCTGTDVCGLVQLKHTGEPEEMYGDNYGYRSGLNPMMVTHLKGIANEIVQSVHLQESDIVLDIGSNDATLLSFFDPSCQLIGMDPSGEKFRSFYPQHTVLVPDFFSADGFLAASGGAKAKVITSIAMFYDLPAPQKFVDDIALSLADGGVWIFEQSYLPSMLKANSYDTICQEHLEYYAVQQIQWLLERAGMSMLGASLNDANGGSIRITAVKNTHPSATSSSIAQQFMEQEQRDGLEDLSTYEHFSERVLEHRDGLNLLLANLRKQGKVVFGLGASTKGNVLLQFCDITERELPCIAEVNKEKFGRFTPGTHIPIVSQDEADARNPDYYLVLPWHFRDGIMQSSRAFLERGGKLIFPLPEISIVGT